MTKGQRLSLKYDAIQKAVEQELLNKIRRSRLKSEHNDCKVIKVNVFGCTELGVFDGKLTFFDECGYHYSLYCDCQLTDLIDILNT